MHRRSKTEFSASGHKASEPRPESLLIAPIERPALLNTLPPDWLTDANPPQFQHSSIDTTAGLDETANRQHKRRLSLQVSGATALPVFETRNRETCPTTVDKPALELVDLNETQIDVEKLLNSTANIS